MFDMLNEDSRVGLWNNDSDSKMVSTVRVDDGRKPFETAVQHPEYNSGAMVIVECYDTIEEAQIGHNNWVNLMKTDKLPDTLTDCANSSISQLLEMLDGKMTFTKEA